MRVRFKEPVQFNVLADAVGARCPANSIVINSITTDSRDVDNQALFVALKGEKYDGHDFVASAISNGAPAAIVSESCEVAGVTLQVNDTLQAYGQLGAWWRCQFHYPVVGLTGSCGKTTVKQMIASILSQEGNTLATHKNYNNEIGVPYTLLQMTNQHDFAVIEMGASKPGDIQYLTGLVKPDVALINNIAAAHIEGFGDLEGVMRAKGELYANLNAGATAIVNNDEAFAPSLKQLLGEQTQITFGIEHDSDVMAKAIKSARGVNEFLLSTPAGEIKIGLSVQGKHNIMNALAASAVALTQNISLERIKAGLESALSVSGRLQYSRLSSGACLIDDSYNANLASVKAAIDVLASSGGKTILVLGELAELGQFAEEIHAQIGEYARLKKIDRLFALGEQVKATARSFGKNSMLFSSHKALADALNAALDSESTVLVKGSRSAQMEQVISYLSKKDTDTCFYG